MMKSRVVRIVKILGIIGVIIFISPYIVRYGFCHQWWLKDKLWAHYFWLCECDSEFEQSLYQDNAEIVVSACEYPVGLAPAAALSSQGRYMVIVTEQAQYVLDLVTNQKQTWPYPTWLLDYYKGVGFWTDRVFLVRGPESNSFNLVDVVNDVPIKLTTFGMVSSGNGETPSISPEALQLFKDADRVIIRPETPIALALNSSSDEVYALRYAGSFFVAAKQFEQLFMEHGISYEILNVCGEGIRCLSPDGRFIATGSAIYTTDGIKVKDLGDVWQGPEASDDLIDFIIGWAHDNSGIYVQFSERYAFFGGPGALTITTQDRVPGAIVKVRVP